MKEREREREREREKERERETETETSHVPTPKEFPKWEKLSLYVKTRHFFAKKAKPRKRGKAKEMQHEKHKMGFGDLSRENNPMTKTKIESGKKNLRR